MSTVNSGIETPATPPVVDPEPTPVTPVTPVTTPPVTTPPETNVAGNEVHTVRINGEDRQMTIAELKASASKVEGADAQFRQGRDGIQVLEIYKKMQEGVSTEEERSTYCNIFNLEGEDRSAILNYTGEAEPPVVEPLAGSPPANPPATPPVDAAGLIGMDNLTPELRSMLERANKTTVAKENNDFDAEVSTHMESDEITKKILSNMDASRRESAVGAIQEMVRGEVLGRLQAGAAYGSVLLKDAVARVSSRVERIGIPTTRPDTPIAGFGPADSSMAAVVNSDKPIERVPSTDPNWDQNVAARVLKRTLDLVRR